MGEGAYEAHIGYGSDMAANTMDNTYGRVLQFTGTIWQRNAIGKANKTISKTTETQVYSIQ